MSDVKSAELKKLLEPETHLRDVDVDALKIDVIPSGWGTLDRYLFLKEGRSELIVVGGRPSMGKSAFMFQAAYNVSKYGTVHVFSLEMDKEQILTRLIAGHLNVSITAIQLGRVPIAALKKAHEFVTTTSYYVDDRSNLDITDIVIAAKEAKARINTQLIIIDYLQLISTPKGHSRNDEVASITKALKALAKDLRVPIIVGSQLSRANEIRGSFRDREGNLGDFTPMLSDLRDSGSIEQDSDMVLFIHRQSKYDGSRAGEADVIIAKNRNGSVGTVKMFFTEEQCRFIDKDDL